MLGQVIKRNFEKIAHQARLSGYWVDSGLCADNITFQVLGHRHKVQDILREYIGIISDDDPFRGSFSESLAEVSNLVLPLVPQLTVSASVSAFPVNAHLQENLEQEKCCQKSYVITCTQRRLSFKRCTVSL